MAQHENSTTSNNSAASKQCNIKYCNINIVQVDYQNIATLLAQR